MAAITPLISNSNTQQSTASTTSQNSDTQILNLATGDYLVFYCASIGSSGTSVESEVTVDFGGTIIAKTVHEGSPSGFPESIRTACLTGYQIVTGDGAKDLTIKYRTLDSGTTYIGGKTLVAIPLADLTENTDYFQTTQEGDADVVTGAITDFSDNLITLTKTYAAEDYIVLASCEVSPNSLTVGGRCRFTVDGVAQKLYTHMDGEATTTASYLSAAYAKVHTFTAGSKVIKIDVASESGSATDARRGRIIVLRKDFFDQVVSASQTTEGTNTGTTYADFISQAYTPNQQEYVMVIGNCTMMQGSPFDSVKTRLYNSTDATAFSDQVSTDFAGTTTDRFMASQFACEQISVVKTYKLQYASEDASGISAVDEGDLIIIGLTTGVNVNTKTFTAGAILTSGITKTFTIDAILKATLTKTFTTDSILQATLTKTFTADAILTSGITKTFTVDAILKATQIKSFTTDAFLQGTITKTFSSDAILVNVRVKDFTANAFLQKQLTKTFSVDALLQATFTKGFTVDSILNASLPKTFSVDSILTATLTKTFSADSILVVESTKLFTVGAILTGARTKTFTVGAIISGPTSKTFTVDAILKATQLKTFTVDAYLFVTSDFASSAELDKPSSITEVDTGGISVENISVDITTVDDKPVVESSEDKPIFHTIKDTMSG